MRMDDSEDEDQEWTEYLNMQDLKEIIDNKWHTQKENDESFKTFEQEFSIKVTDSFRTKSDKIKWLNDLISFSKSWTTIKGRALNRAEIDEMSVILQSLAPADEV